MIFGMVLDPFPANKVFNYFFKLNDCIMKRIFSQSTKWGSIIALAVLFLFASEAKADHRYYYYPEYQIYYDNYRDVYVYFGYDGMCPFTGHIAWEWGMCITETLTTDTTPGLGIEFIANIIIVDIMGIHIISGTTPITATKRNTVTMENITMEKTIDTIAKADITIECTIMDIVENLSTDQVDIMVAIIPEKAMEKGEDMIGFTTIIIDIIVAVI